MHWFIRNAPTVPLDWGPFGLSKRWVYRIRPVLMFKRWGIAVVYRAAKEEGRS